MIFDNTTISTVLVLILAALVSVYLVSCFQKKLKKAILYDYLKTPPHLVNWRSTKDMTTLNPKQEQLVLDAFTQYHRQKGHSHTGHIKYTNHVGETIQFGVKSQKQLSDKLNGIFGLTKHVNTYPAIYKKLNKKPLQK